MKHQKASKKVSRKQKSKKLIIANPLIKAAWDTKKTLLENYTALALKTNSRVESIIAVKAQKTQLRNNPAWSTIDGESKTQSIVSTVCETLNPIAQKLHDQFDSEVKHAVKITSFNSDQEILVLEKLMVVYGNDYGAMARDIKLNRYQLSKGQLSKKFEKLSWVA